MQPPMCHTSGYTWQTEALVPSWCTQGTPLRLIAPSLVIYTGWGKPECTAEQGLSNVNWLTVAWFSTQGSLLHQSLPGKAAELSLSCCREDALSRVQESCIARLGGPQEDGLAEKRARERGKPKMVVKGTKKGKTKPNCEDRTRRGKKGR